MIPVYKIHHSYPNKKNGDVAKLEPKIRLESSNLELLCLEVTQRYTKAFFGIAWYHSPASAVDNSPFEELREELREIDSEYREIILGAIQNVMSKLAKIS